MTEIHDQLAAAALEAARLARAVSPAQFSDRTPCPDYDVRALIEHLMQEIVLHSWDLAVATGQTPRFPDDVVTTVLHRLDTEMSPGQYPDWYGTPARTASDSLLDRAVARSGRDPLWQREP